MVELSLDKSLNFVSNNTVYIHGIFDESISKNVIDALNVLVQIESNKKHGKIVVDINSDGGTSYFLKNLLSIFEFAKKSGVIIETRALARAFSCASILASSGTKGHRFIGEHTEHLCHLGKPACHYINNDIEIDRQALRSKSHFDFVRSCYKKYAKIPNLEKVIHNDLLFVHGQKIIDWGLADKFY